MGGAGAGAIMGGGTAGMAGTAGMTGTTGATGMTGPCGAGGTGAGSTFRWSYSRRSASSWIMGLAAQSGIFASAMSSSPTGFGLGGHLSSSSSW